MQKSAEENRSKAIVFELLFCSSPALQETRPDTS